MKQMEFQTQMKIADGDSEPKFLIIAFIKIGKNFHSEDIFLRKTIDSLYYEGGSPQEVLAIFLVNFEITKKKMLAILTLWDSSFAGGHSVMERSGKFYDANLYELTTSLQFHHYKGKISDQLSTCDCQIFDQDHRPTGFEKAKFRTVKEVRELIENLDLK